MMDIAETIARQIEPKLWARWDDRANRVPGFSEKILAPLVNESLARVSHIIGLYESLRNVSEDEDNG